MCSLSEHGFDSSETFSCRESDVPLNMGCFVFTLFFADDEVRDVIALADRLELLEFIVRIIIECEAPMFSLA